MTYTMIALDDSSEIFYSGRMDDGSVRVYVEKKIGGKLKGRAQCILPECTWVDSKGLSDQEIGTYQLILQSLSDLILEEDEEEVLSYYHRSSLPLLMRRLSS